MRTGYVKAALVGGIGGAVAMTATAALAGSGIGGIFNLGQLNTVNETSTLQGSKNGSVLQVTNTASSAVNASGIGITVNPGKAPLVVNSNTRVPNLNADMVDGYNASALSRAGQGFRNDLFTSVLFFEEETSTIIAPADGYVRVDASVLANDDGADVPCTPCKVYMRIRDDVSESNDVSPIVIGRLESPGGGDSDWEELTRTWVFPVTAGTRTYTMETAQNVDESQDPARFSNPVVQTTFLPFGYSGGGAPLEPPNVPALAARRAR